MFKENLWSKLKFCITIKMRFNDKFNDNLIYGLELLFSCKDILLKLLLIMQEKS